MRKIFIPISLTAYLGFPLPNPRLRLYRVFDNWVFLDNNICGYSVAVWVAEGFLPRRLFSPWVSGTPAVFRLSGGLSVAYLNANGIQLVLD